MRIVDSSRRIDREVSSRGQAFIFCYILPAAPQTFALPASPWRDRKKNASERERPNLHYPSEEPRLEEDDRDEVADHHGADGVEHKVLDFGLSVEAPVRGEQGVQDQGEKAEDVLGDLAGLLSGCGLNDLLRGIRDVLGELGLRGGNPRCWRGVSGASAMGEVEVGVSKGMPSYLFRKRGVRNRDDAGDQKILLNCRESRSFPFRGPGRHS